MSIPPCRLSCKPLIQVISIILANVDFGGTPLPAVLANLTTLQEISLTVSTDHN